MPQILLNDSDTGKKHQIIGIKR